MRILLITVLTMVFSLSGCSSQKKLAKTAPFEVGQATCQSWVGGRAESGSGMKLMIPMLSVGTETINMQQAYFRGKIADLRLDVSNGKNMMAANFRNQSTQKPDIIMHGDSKQEVGNQPPKLQEEFPFELSENDCVISYLEGDKIKYYKIEGVKEVKPLIYQ